MGIYAMGQNLMDGVGQLGCDTASDAADLPAFAESNNLKPGSTCLCKATSDVYMMGSDGSWDPI